MALLQLPELLTLIFGILAAIGTIITLFPGPQLRAYWRRCASRSLETSQPAVPSDVELGDLGRRDDDNVSSTPVSHDQRQGSVNALGADPASIAPPPAAQTTGHSDPITSIAELAYPVAGPPPPVGTL